MKKILSFLTLSLLFCSSVFAWNSETGTGVVSANENIIRASLEATQVLQSDTLTNLYGVTILGGTTNYASHDSGGVYSTRNVVSSRDVVLSQADQFYSWGIVNGQNVRIGLSADNTFVLPPNISVQNSSQATLYVSSLLRSSGDSFIVRASIDSLAVANNLRVSGDTQTTGSVWVGSSLKDTNGNALITTPAATSAVNSIGVVNSATGVSPRLVVSGNDSNISLILDSKGTGVVSLNHAFVNNVVGLVDGATINTDASTGNHFRVVLAGNRTLARPTNPTYGQKAIWEIIQGTGSNTVSFDNAFIFGTDVTVPTLSTVVGKRDFVAGIYNGTSWDVVAVSKGYNKV